MTKTVEILDRLVSFDTVSAKSNLALIAYAEDLLQGVGFRTTRLPSPDGQKAGLFAEIGPSVAGGVLLSGHTDVVPTDGQAWSRPPFRLTQDGERLYGRGTTDMKGFVASALALACRSAEAKLTAPLKIVLSYDEEIGCVGIAQMQEGLAPLLGRPQLCIVGEPTEMAVAIGHKGKLSLEARFEGQTGHSALAPRFVNALHLAGDFMTALRALQAELAAEGPQDAGYDIPYSTVHIGRLAGGQAVNMVPDHAEMAFEIRHLPDIDPDNVLRRIERLGSQIEENYVGGRVQLRVLNRYPGFAADADSAYVRQAQMLTGTPISHVDFGTEAGTFAALGLPTLVCGPGSMEGQGHQPDEYIEAGQLALCDHFLDRLVSAMCIRS